MALTKRTCENKDKLYMQISTRKSVNNGTTHVITLDFYSVKS